MNTEEKKPLESQETTEVVSKPEAVKSSPVAKTNSGGNNKGLSQNAKIAIIAGVSCVLVVAIVLALVLGGVFGGNKNQGVDKNPGGNSGNVTPGGNGGNSGNTGDSKVTYTINISSVGGMAFASHPVYIHDTNDRGEILDYGQTDANGNVEFTLDPNGEYAVVVDFPDGYNGQKYYPLVSTKLDIKVTSELLPDTGLVGVSYQIGSIMHDFTVTTTTGEQISISQLLEEKDAVVLNFWFSTCEPCQAEFPVMQTIYEKYQEDIAIIALNPPETQAQDTLETIKQFQSAYGLTFYVAQDLLGLNRAFGVEGYPTSVVIDRYGVVSLLHAGSITSEVVFDNIFAHFTAENYEQKLIYDYNDIVPRPEPDVDMPSSSDISNVFDGGSIPGVEYLPYPDNASEEEKKYSWPFVIETVTLDGTDCQVIKTSNAGIEGSYCQMVFNVHLNKGEVLAFDYYSSTELSSDILYVVVDGKDIYSISGQSDDWSTCYSFVAEEDGTYQVGLVYQKDTSINTALDTVFLKNLRIVTEDQIDSATYIYRFAATNPDKYGSYLDYVEIHMGNDGYYHVGSPTGPILLANLMSYTRFSDESTVYYMAVELYENGFITADEYDRLIDYCSYASNSSIYGVSSVTEELRTLLTKISYYLGDQTNENDWLRFCCYYDAYGTNGVQLVDPIQGLATFAAVEVTESTLGDTDFPNQFVYDRMIMPRGFIAKFTPTVSGTYLITSFAPDPSNPGYGLETNAWVFTAEGFDDREQWYTYENNFRNNYDVNNCYMVLYLEAGRDYYIDIAFYDVYQEGTINFRVERLGGEGYYKFALASPAYFTTILESGDSMTSWIIHGGIDVVLGEDGIWREKREDGNVGSIIYADFTQKTPLFSGTILEMIEQGSFNFSLSEGDQLILGYLAMNDNDPEKCKEYLKNIWKDDYDELSDVYKVDEVLAGITHGEGQDYTNVVRKYAENIIVVGYNELLGEYIEEGDARIGCVVVTEELSVVLQLLMDKYTFMNGTAPNLVSIENSWTKLCYYSHYYCAATPK